MEPFNSHTLPYSSSSSSSSSYSYNPRDNDKSIPSYLSSLHSVRKPILLSKPMLKKPIAPLPPTPPKVYKVDSSNFKQVVQKLTSIPEFQNSASRRLQDVAPPPLNISSAPKLLRSFSTNSTTTTSNEMAISDAVPQHAASSQSFPSPLPAIFRDLMDDNLFDPIPPSNKGFGDELDIGTSPVLGFTLTPNFSSFLNETLDNIAGNDDVENHDDDKPTCKSSESWGLLLSPLGFNMSPTISYSASKPTKLSDCFGSLSPLEFGLSPSSAAWCSLALASPGVDLSLLGQTRVL